MDDLRTDLPRAQTVVAADGTTVGYLRLRRPRRHAGPRVPRDAGLRRRVRVADYPAMALAFAEAMGLGRFGVWGYSGGGPYAVAGATALVDRLSGVAVAAGMGEVGVWAGRPPLVAAASGRRP